ncbi:hypothetical protein U3516DRAFT_786019 [Neocallimastix sp. 'constans']
MDIPKIKDEVLKLFKCLINNTTILAIPKNEAQRKDMKILKLGNIKMISETERYVIRINHKIFRLKSVKIILIQNLNDKIILLADRPYYIDTFEQVFNEEYNLNLPFIETTDSLF